MSSQATTHAFGRPTGAEACDREAPDNETTPPPVKVRIMDARTIEMAASLATTLIIAVTAFAALRQIRHNRMANELQIHLNFVSEAKTAEITDAIHWTHAFAKHIRDPDFARHLLQDEESKERDRLFNLVRFLNALRPSLLSADFRSD